MAEMEKKLRQDDSAQTLGLETDIGDRATTAIKANDLPVRPKKDGKSAKVRTQKLGRCEKCGYLSSQTICKACTLLEGLNRSRPKTAIAVDDTT